LELALHLAYGEGAIKAIRASQHQYLRGKHTHTQTQFVNPNAHRCLLSGCLSKSELQAALLAR
jgi:hypothetical protein